MESGENNVTKKKAGKLKHFAITILSLIVVYIILMNILRLLGIINLPPSPTAPPDLSSCTSFEIEYVDSAFALFRGPSIENIFNASEIEYLESLKRSTVKDPEAIKILIDQVRTSEYSGEAGDREPFPSYHINCFCGDDLLASMTFAIYSMYHDGHLYSPEGTGWRVYPEFAPEVRPLLLRYYCVINIEEVKNRLSTIAKFDGYEISKWCDDYEKNGFRLVYLTCPATEDGKCHYAMNPNCTPDSPDDMVLLFETKDGWNQHGGPELFTFDNHEPRGGCVLLNDGTVKFIRTEAELNALRWSQ